MNSISINISIGNNCAGVSYIIPIKNDNLITDEKLIQCIRLGITKPTNEYYYYYALKKAKYS